MHQAELHVPAVPPAAGADEPTVGAIKHALHELSDSKSASGSRDYANTLREVHDLVRRLAHLNGIDPDAALQRSRDAIQSQRERLTVVSAAVPGPASNQR